VSAKIEVGQVWLASGRLDHWRVIIVSGEHVYLRHVPNGTEISRTKIQMFAHGFTLVEPAPTPKPSRWLEPSSVPAGAPMRVCTFAGPCYYPAQAFAVQGINACNHCTAHFVLCRREAVVKLPPSVLVPVRRWYILGGFTRPARVASQVARLRAPGYYDYGWFVERRGRVEGHRVRKVRAISVYATDFLAAWVLT
jgi:hypothetical protein